MALNDAEHDDSVGFWKFSVNLKSKETGRQGAGSCPHPLTILEVITPCVVYKHVKNKQWPWADSTLQNNFKACSVV